MRTVAIARQGGGSHTVFTGGVLQRLLADRDHRVVALSGEFMSGFKPSRRLFGGAALRSR